MYTVYVNLLLESKMSKTDKKVYIWAQCDKTRVRLTKTMSHDRLIFILEIPIPERLSLYWNEPCFRVSQASHTYFLYVTGNWQKMWNEAHYSLRTFALVAPVSHS